MPRTFAPPVVQISNASAREITCAGPSLKQPLGNIWCVTAIRISLVRCRIDLQIVQLSVNKYPILPE
jgi:hypothetical protein